MLHSSCFCLERPKFSRERIYLGICSTPDHNWIRVNSSSLYFPLLLSRTITDVNYHHTDCVVFVANVGIKFIAETVTNTIATHTSCASSTCQVMRERVTLVSDEMKKYLNWSQLHLVWKAQFAKVFLFKNSKENFSFVVMVIEKNFSYSKSFNVTNRYYRTQLSCNFFSSYWM